MITFRASWLMVKYQSSVPNLLVNTPRSPDTVNGSATLPRERQRRGHSDVGNIYDHETQIQLMVQRHFLGKDRGGVTWMLVISMSMRHYSWINMRKGITSVL
jgi:hypothetical protein